MAFIKQLLRIWRLIFTLPIVLYQKLLSPLLSGSQGSCRYHPSCSEYSRQAILSLGVLPGIVLGTARILRCHALFTGGSDPVPSRFSLDALVRPYRTFRQPRK